MARIHSSSRNHERGSRNHPLRTFGIAALVSQLLVLRYLYNQWPHLNHPLGPPTSSFRGGSQGTQDQSGVFHGIPVSYHPAIPQGGKSSNNNVPSSSMQCIGENFEPQTAWMFRSCQFQNLCYDVQDKEFVYIQSQRESNLKDAFQQIPRRNRGFTTITTLATDNIAVSLGAIYPQMTSQEMSQKLKWFPKIKTQTEMAAAGGYYELPSGVAWVPLVGTPGTFHSNSIFWSDLFPIYTLLSVFGLTRDDTGQIMKPFLFVKGEATSTGMYKPFLGFLGSGPDHVLGGNHLNDLSEFQDTSSGGRRSTLVCAKKAVAGIGMIADRGFNLPDRLKTQSPAYRTQVPYAVSVNLSTHNLAQGITLKGFRDYMLRNLGLDTKSTKANNMLEVSFHFQARTLDTPDFRSQLNALNLKPKANINRLEKLVDPSSMIATAKTIATSSVLVVPCCDEEVALAAAFLPDEALLIILYNQETNKVPLERLKQDFPIWELIDNAAYFRAHWISLGGGVAAAISEIVQVLQLDLAVN